MKVLYYGVFDNNLYRSEYSIIKGLEKLGVEIIPSNFRIEQNIIKDWLNNKDKVDLVFIQNGNPFKKEYLEVFDKPIVYWASEFSLSKSKHLLDNLKKTDFVIVHSSQVLKYCQENNIPAKRMINAYSKKDYYYLNEEYIYDISFVGTTTYRRKIIFDLLKREGIKINQKTVFNTSEINQIYNQSKVILHIHAMNETYLPTRLFESLPTKGCLLIEDLKDNYDQSLGNSFFEEFSSIRELKRKISFLLGNESYRSNLVEKSNKISNFHTWESRSKEISIFFYNVINNNLSI